MKNFVVSVVLGIALGGLAIVGAQEAKKPEGAAARVATAERVDQAAAAAVDADAAAIKRGAEATVKYVRSQVMRLKGALHLGPRVQVQVRGDDHHLTAVCPAPAPAVAK